MTLILIKQRSRDLRTSTRKKLLGTLAGPLAWSLAGLFFLNRGMWSSAMPADAGLSTGLEFCRREIERQRALLRRILLWSFGPLLLTIATFILALAMVGTRDRGIFPNGLPS